MDTKWKKSKIIVSFAAFFLGMTLLLTNFFSMVVLLLRADFHAGTDYQETDEFAHYISARLEDLIGAAAGGEEWYKYSYGISYEFGYGYEEGTAFSRWWDGQLDDLADGVSEAVSESAPEENGTQEAVTGEITYTDGSVSSRESLDAYMEGLSRDKNLLFAVVHKGKLLYTNLEGLSAQVDQEIGTPDFTAYLPEEGYNFTLLYNENGDGRVEIVKDGQPVDVYGDGTYDEGCRWFVPGYTNFQADEKSREAVVFLAVAAEPELYVTSRYDEGMTQYGERLYNMRTALLANEKKLERLAQSAVGMGAALLLLLFSFLLRKELREARRWLGDRLAGVWQEGKRLVFWGLPFMLLGMSILMGSYQLMLYRGRGFILMFWLLYFGFLDRKYNKGRQKRVLAPVWRSLRTIDLERPVQKRLVRKEWLILAYGLALLLLPTCIFWVMLSGLHWNGIMTVLVLWIVCAVLYLVCCYLYFRKNRRLAEDIGALTDRVAAVRAGELTEQLAFPEDSDLKAAAEDLNDISEGLEAALAERTKSERMKVELVANVSHDLKTPLTSVVSYIELLKQEKDLPEHVKDYIRILGEKTERLGSIVQDVFEVSKAASGQLPVNLEKLDLGKLLRQTLADMSAEIERSGFTLKVSIPEEPVSIQADGQRLYRVFQNLLQNALKYSLKGSRIYLTLTEEDGRARAVLKNTSAQELDKDIDFTGRFVRGDASRTDGGTGLGLSIAKSFTEACGGRMEIQADADLFTAVVTFPVDAA